MPKITKGKTGWKGLNTCVSETFESIPKLKDSIKGPKKGTQGFYLFLILLANAKAGTDSNKRMFQAPVKEDTEPVILYQLPPLELLPATKSADSLATKASL